MRTFCTVMCVVLLVMVRGGVASAIPNCSQVNTGWCYLWHPEGCTPYIDWGQCDPEKTLWRCAYLEGYPDCEPSYWQWCWCPGYDGPGCDCLPLGSPITMADGSTKPIEKIQEGDRVLAYDDVSAAAIASVVTSVHAPFHVDHYIIINDHIRMTETHPVLSSGKWEAAVTLEVGNMLTAQDGSDVPIRSVRRVAEDVTVYNFQVAAGTYVAYGVVVHNKEDCKDYMPSQ